MKTKELREKTKEELENLVKELKKKLFQLKLEIKIGKSKKTSEIRKIKKEIATILTILKEKENA